MLTKDSGRKELPGPEAYCHWCIGRVSLFMNDTHHDLTLEEAKALAKSLTSSIEQYENLEEGLKYLDPITGE